MRHESPKENTMGLPTSKQEKSSEFVPFEEGTYKVSLKKIDLDICSEYKTENFNNGKGLRYQSATLTWDIDGDEYREQFVKVSTNEKAKFYNRICALLGRDLTSEDQLGWELGKNSNTNAEYDDYFKPDQDIYAKQSGGTTTDLKEAELTEPDAEGKQSPIIVHKKKEWVLKGQHRDGVIGYVTDLTVNGETLLGKECLLVLKVNEKGYNRADAGAASPLPKQGQQRRGKPVGAPN
jgi:hypothetical protein